MTREFCWLILLGGLALVGQAGAAGLDDIKRPPLKEPVYESKAPQYCLLVFGPEAKTRVWMVLDGDVLYLDRNGNGDLTDPGERIAAREVYRNSEERPDVEVIRDFELVGWHEKAKPILTCGPRVQWFHVLELLPREDWEDQDWVKACQEKPISVSITTPTGRGQWASLRFAPSAREAPVLHFDGPRRFALSEKFGKLHFRPGELADVAVELHTRWGQCPAVKTDVYEVPEGIHPVAEIEFPPSQPGEAPIRVRVKLTERC
jgi:hypothetical protein